jgi:hypothetical protein
MSRPADSAAHHQEMPQSRNERTILSGDLQHMVIPCPVCNFPLQEPPVDWNYCPCCGTEFGYHDSGRSYEEIRREWLATGAQWWSPVRHPPADWSLWNQIAIFYEPHLASIPPQVNADHVPVHWLEEELIGIGSVRIRLVSEAQVHA